MENTFTHFSFDEVTAALAFAKTDHTSGRGKDKYTIKGASLDRDTLRNIANETGDLWASRGKRPGQCLYAAKREVLSRKLTRRDRQDSNRFNAYSSAVSKLFSARSKWSKKRREPSNTHPSPLPGIPVIIGKNGQREWTF